MASRRLGVAGIGLVLVLGCDARPLSRPAAVAPGPVPVADAARLDAVVTTRPEVVDAARPDLVDARPTNRDVGPEVSVVVSDAAGAETGPCGAGNIMIGLRAALGAAWWYRVVTPTCSQGSNWYRIYDASGVQLPVLHPCAADCGSCGGLVCSDTCYAIGSLSDQWVTATWDGTVFAPGGCGADGHRCVERRCVPAGTYTVKLCGLTATAPDQEEYCFDLLFQFPATTLIRATLPTTQLRDAGS